MGGMMSFVERRAGQDLQVVQLGVERHRAQRAQILGRPAQILGARILELGARMLRRVRARTPREVWVVVEGVGAPPLEAVQILDVSLEAVQILDDLLEAVQILGGATPRREVSRDSARRGVGSATRLEMPVRDLVPLHGRLGAAVGGPFALR
eukprot:2021294-Pyramimonas_sp.AAC.1